MSCAAMTSSKTVMFRYRLSSDSIRAVPGRLSLVYRNLPQQPEIAQHAAGAEHHRSQRIVGYGNRQTGLLADALVEIFDKRAAAREHDAAVADIGAQLGWGTLQRHADGVDDGGDALRKRFADFVVVNRDRARNALDQIAAF